MKKIRLPLVLFLSSLLASPSLARADETLLPVQFLAGKWKGGGTAEDAQGKGTTDFTWDVGHQVLVRRDHSEYAATANRPASIYESLMVIYHDPAAKDIEASYFDNGNHVIHYKLAPTDKSGFAQFISDNPNGPTFRLTYSLGVKSDLTITFEIKPPGPDSAFQPIAQGVAQKE